MSDGRIDEAKGRAKEALGALRDDDQQRAEGRAEQSKGALKQAGEKLSEAAQHVKDAVTK